MRPANDIDPASLAVVFTNDASELAQILMPHVMAVVCAPQHRAPWQVEVAQAVQNGEFVIERCNLEVGPSESLCHLLEAELSHEALTFETRLALIDDLCALADRLTELASCTHMMLRLFTEAPTERCGFHVDTVPPARPCVGLLKVYNGQGTLYVEPRDLLDVREFYSYLARRERLAAKRNRAVQAGTVAEAEALRSQLLALDATLPFVRSQESVHTVPTGAAVAFRSLDVRQHWSASNSGAAWIHCSPMSGVTRLVVNFTPLDGRWDRPQ